MNLVVSGLDSIDKLMDETIVSGRKAMEDASPIVIQAIQANFDAKGARGGHEEWDKVPVSWLMKRQTWPGGKPLPMHMTPEQAAYIADHKPLVDTGNLRNSFAYADQETSDGNVEGEVYSTADYAAQHDQGVSGKIRKREIFFVTEEDATNVANEVADQLAKALGG